MINLREHLSENMLNNLYLCRHFSHGKDRWLYDYLEKQFKDFAVGEDIVKELEIQLKDLESGNDFVSPSNIYSVYLNNARVCMRNLQYEIKDYHDVDIENKVLTLMSQIFFRLSVKYEKNY